MPFFQHKIIKQNTNKNVEDMDNTINQLNLTEHSTQQQNTHFYMPMGHFQRYIIC